MASSVQRKLTAILMADVKGYSRLMGADEEDTLRRLREYQEVTRRLIEAHRGRLVDAPGDALLADFASVVDAVSCAVEVQNELGRRNTELPADRRMDLRMGINLGDVIVDGDSLYGDGVNIAARLEPLAAAGGICISGSVYDNVRNKLQLQWEYLGEQTLKNISQPIRAYRLSLKERSEVTKLPQGIPEAMSTSAYTEATRVGSLPLVGRQKELSFLQERVEGILSGTGSAVFITGSTGIGKTRLVEEVRQYAQRKGCQWFEGKYDNTLSQPYKAWSDMVKGYIRQSESQPIQSLVGPYAVHLAKIAPEIEELSNFDSAPSAQLDLETERFRLHEGVTQFFIRMSRDAPLVLFIDDLQWAPSMELVHHMARNVGNQRVLMLATYRDDQLKQNPSLWNTVLAMNRGRLVHPLLLEALDEGEVERLISHTTDEAVASQLIGMVYRKTEGNPFFIEEVLRLLQDRKSIVETETGWKVREPTSLETPESVKAVINERLEQLGKDAEELLRMASVIGQEFPLRLLKELISEEEEGLIEVMDRCEGAGLILSQQVRGDEIYRFTHDVMQEALYESIGPARRRRHHIRVGQAVEKLYSSRLEEWYDGLALHFLKGNDLEKAIEYSHKAGDRACAIYTWGRASIHFQTALELLEELEAGPRRQAEVLEKLALATMLFGKGKAALGYWEKALALYETLGDFKKAGAVHLRLSQQYHGRAMGTRDPEKAYTHTCAAIKLLEPEGDTVELAQAYTRLGFVTAHRLNEPLSGGIVPLEKGLALAQRLDDAVAVAEAKTSLGHVLVYHAGEIKRGLELTHEGCEAAKKSGDTVLLAEAVCRVSDAHLLLLDANNGELWAREAVDISNQSGALRHQIESSFLLGRASILRGDIPQALQSLETAQEAVRKARNAGVQFGGIQHPPRLAMAMVPFFLGDWDKCESELLNWRRDASAASSPVLTFIAWASGWLCLERGDLAGAKAQLDEAVARCEARGEKSFAAAPLALLSQVASKGGELDEAASHLRRVQEIMSQPEDWYGLTGEAHLAEGILWTAEKRWEEANGAFQEAVGIHRRYNLPYYEGRALFEWAEMHESRDGARDRERGRQLLDQSLSIFQKIQAAKMVKKVQAHKDRLGMSEPSS